MYSFNQQSISRAALSVVLAAIVITAHSAEIVSTLLYLGMAREAIEGAFLCFGLVIQSYLVWASVGEAEQGGFSLRSGFYLRLRQTLPPNIAGWLMACSFLVVSHAARAVPGFTLTNIADVMIAVSAVSMLFHVLMVLASARATELAQVRVADGAA